MFHNEAPKPRASFVREKEMEYQNNLTQNLQPLTSSYLVNIRNKTHLVAWKDGSSK